MRYKAAEIEERLYSGMSQETEFVPASDYDALAAELEAVKASNNVNLHPVSLTAALAKLNAELEAVKAERDALAKRINHDGTPVDIASLCAEIDTVTDELKAVKAENRAITNRFGDGLKRANSFNPNEPLGKVIDRCVMALVNLDDLKKEHALVCDFNCFLNTELARVKAESLRVVKVGKECKLGNYNVRYFAHPSEPRPCVRLYSLNGEDAEWLVEKLGDIQRSWWSSDTIVQPVLLKAWEDQS